MIPLLFLLLFGHFLADYPLQGEFLSQAKNRNTAVGKTFWKHALPAHAFIHAGFVTIFTNSIILGLLEFVVHGVTDFFKCENKISLNVDQAIHIGCKVVWVAIVVWSSN